MSAWVCCRVRCSGGHLQHTVVALVRGRKDDSQAIFSVIATAGYGGNDYQGGGGGYGGGGYGGGGY